MKQEHDSIILSLGGSLIVPNGGIDTKFLSAFNIFIRRHIKTGRRFFIITGGGTITRNYQQAARDVQNSVTHEDLDWLGIHTTRVNGHLMRAIFRDLARPQIMKQFAKEEKIRDYPVVIGAGWKPGWSTDYDAVALCKFYGARTVVNMTNTGGVYTADPRKDKTATRIDKISWEKYRAMVGDKWSPGLSTAFDPVASRLAYELGVKVIVLDGRDLDNLDKALEGNKFVGTVIE